MATPTMIEGSRRRRALAASALAVVAALAAGCGSPPPPVRLATSDDVARYAEPVPATMTDAANAAFGAGRKFFIWRDGETTVSVGAQQYVPLHYAVAPGAPPDPFSVLVRLEAKVTGSSEMRTQLMTASWSGKTAPTAYVGNSGPSRLSGNGTAAVYLVSMGSISPQATPISNVLAVPVSFGP